MHKYLLAILIFCSPYLVAQEYLSGKVLDAKTKTPLAFVTLLINKGNTGVSTDIDGKYKLPAQGVKTITLSYIGYQKKTLDIDQLNRKNGLVYLKEESFRLQEVTILPGKNPADRIIEKAIDNRDINNPEKATSFFYESYNKLVVTGIRDSSILFKKNDSITVVDSFNLATFEYLEDYHYFIMETVSEKNHIPPDFQRETIKASRVSGFKKPFFTLLATQMQSFSLYNNHINIFSKNYLSPISKGGTSKYLFEIKDTLYKGSDTVFVMAYQPKKGKNIEGLKGSISINSNRYAVENFTASPADTSKWPVNIQQKYEFIDGKQWFPVQLNINVFFESLYPGVFTTVMIGKSYIKNIQLNSKEEKENFDKVAISLSPEIQPMPESYWNQNRSEPLSQKEVNTYQYVDSLGEEHQADRLLNLTEQLVKGSISWRDIDFTVNRFFRFNGYEGFRPGLGVETNDKIVKGFRIGAYGAYGFKDKKLKYGGHMRYESQSKSEFQSKLLYSNDVIESSGIQFYRNKYDALSNGGIQNLFILQMDAAESFTFETSIKSFNYFEFTAFGIQQFRKVNSDYRYLENGRLVDRFNLTEAGLNIRFVYKEKYADFLGQKLPIESKYPMVYLKYTRGFEGIIENGYNYNRLDISISNKIVIKNFGETRMLFRAGFIDEDLPLTALYRLIGTNDNNNLSIATPYNFQTAFPNEFYSDQYLNFFIRHNFGSLLFKAKKFSPDILLIHSMALGQLRNRASHVNSDLKTFEKGFYESGLLFNNLIKQEILLKGYFIGLGLGGFYRYGPYQFEEDWDNLALKFTTYLSF